MEGFFNRHYITVDRQSRIVSGWSDGPHPGRDAANAVCINPMGGYQFRLKFADGSLSEENPSLFDWDGMIPLYRWDGESVIPRGTDEIEADRAAIPEPARVPTESDRIAALEEAFILSDETAIALYEAQLEQEEINAAQDEALIELYEIIGG